MSDNYDPTKDPQCWPTATCSAGCHKQTLVYAGDIVYFETKDRLGRRVCAAQIVCPECLSVSIIQMMPPVVDLAVNELGAKKIVVAPGDPLPASFKREPDEDAPTADEFLDTLSMMKDMPHDVLFARLTGLEAV